MSAQHHHLHVTTTVQTLWEVMSVTVLMDIDWMLTDEVVMV